ncbi:MAG: valine--tRNA ligase [Acidimicrobiales bacterium]
MREQPAELAKAYDPSESEKVVAERWAANRVFHAAAGPDGSDVPSYSVVIPPPNVTAALHLGHALNNTLQDVLVRYHRMRGFNTLWMPGTDHAGIATQTVVEKRMLSQGIKRLDIGREEFIRTTQKWKDEYEAVILSQLTEMGASCDFERTRFTMDDMCATAVRHAFYMLFRDGLIYRGKRLVNWDPVSGTALSDDEVEMEDVQGHMWYLRYPLADGSGHVTVATTRPETMFGDTAVAVNPNDPRAAELRGKSVLLPIVGRTIPIVEDDYVVMADPDGDAKAQFATGFLKVTPAHDPNDWEIGLRHLLPVVNVMAPDASISDQWGWDDISEDAGPFIGMSREDARTAVVDWFRDHNLLDEIRDYSHSVGHSYRSHVPIEPWLSDQWYVASTDDRLRGSALRAQRPEQVVDLDHDLAAGEAPGDGGLRFIPDRYAKTFQSWHENIRDWCISRQLWWGHQIPVWNRTKTLGAVAPEVAAALADVEPGTAVHLDSAWTSAGAVHTARAVTDTDVVEAICVPNESTLRRVDRADQSMDETALIAALEADGFERDPDVLDTWFSSALWPMSTMGWPHPEDFPETDGLLDAFNPTSMLSTAREIITLWVSRMVMFNRYFLDGQLPFTDVFIHAMVQDGHGQKMSKSLGNGVDPRDIIYSHGADAMRFTLVQMTTDTQDVRIPVDMVCPHTGTAFAPQFITTSAGHHVAAPEQISPSDPTRNMVSAYGVAAGVIEPTDDSPLARNTSSKFDAGRNFSNKVWNAVRFAVGRLDGASGQDAPVTIDQLGFSDRWILARLQNTVTRLETAVENYQFNVYADTLYDFIWRDLCDVYLEAVKPTIDASPAQQVVLGSALDASLRLMHPVCPFLTEALWPHVSAARNGSVDGLDLRPSALLAAAAWPTISPQLADDVTVAQFDRTIELITQIRTLRSKQNVKPKQRVTIHAPEPVLDLIARAGGLVETLAGVGSVESSHGDRPAVASPLAFEGSQVFLSGLVDEVDLDAERSRLTKLVEQKTQQVDGFEKRLGNPGYVNNAKPELVEETRGLLATAKADLDAAQAALGAL